MLRRGLCIGLLAACGHSDRAAVEELNDAPSSPHLILIVLDTLRTEHLSVYGYERPTSPQLEAFAATATRYDRAQAAAPWTLPSHASMFTGLYPFEHGAHTLDPRRVGERVEGLNVAPLSQAHTTLAEELRARGYTTGAVIANKGFLGERYQLDQGFESYEVDWWLHEDVNERAFRFLETHRAEPFFLFLNYMDTHGPYNCAPRPEFPPSGSRYDAQELLKEYKHHVLEGTTPPPGVRERLLMQYDTSIANLDEGLGELFDRLRELGLFDDALIIVTSDHGEYFGEKDLVTHSKDVYQGAVRIPLIVKAPGQTVGRVDDRLISHVHLGGLVLAHTAAGLTKGTFASYWPREAVLAENYFTRMEDLKSSWGPRFMRVRSVLYDGPYKFIRSSDGQDELYHLDRDPEELHNLVDEEPERAERMRLELVARMPNERRAEQEAAPELTEEEMQTMRDLGYAGDEDE